MKQLLKLKRRTQTASVILSMTSVAGCLLGTAAAERPQTFCNPLDLDYRFQLEEPSRREAADPAVVFYDHEYWLFASKSGGYWHSRDFSHWIFVDGKDLPIEDYAPASAVIGGRLCYTAFDTKAIFQAEDPWTGRWRKVGDLKMYSDPALFQDDDGRVYVYYGCSAGGGISVVELDPTNGFKEIGQPILCFKCDPKQRGWEVPGDDNSREPGNPPWIEGAWMTKHDGKYYLQYAGPGTEFKSYADGVVVGNTATGPFVYAPYSPFSHKPTGFAAGAGHSGTFQDAQSNWWHVATMTISVRHMFERRIGVFPAGFCDDGQMFCNTYLGDYPQFLPGMQRQPTKNNSPGWMLLSYAKKAEASSTRAGLAVSNAFDENMRTWWCAETGNAGEWLKVDLGKSCRIEAIQINFADEGASARGKLHDDAYRFYIEASKNGTKWERILDCSDNRRDAPHYYEQLQHPVTARYVRLMNVHCPAGARFSISGFRIFGEELGKAPAPVKSIVVLRNSDDGRKATISWAPAPGTDFYIVRYGLGPDRLFNNYQIYNATNAQINSLNRGVGYYFGVDAVNDSGVSHSRAVLPLKP